MKSFLLFICIILAPNIWAQDPAYPVSPAAPQNLISAEYFFDVDPGFGNATAISISAGVDINNVMATVSASGLSNGVHRFCLRTKSSDGKWSITNMKDFIVDFDPVYPTTATVQNITRAEYFIDTDPGFGNGNSISLTAATDLPNVPATINTAGLPNGIHRLLLRTQGADGKWSITAQKDFAVEFNPPYPTVASPQNLVQAEYFIDTDPGFGNGVSIPMTAAVDLANVAASINTAGLNIGVHRVFLRTKSMEGRWSITGNKDFLVDENPAYPTVPTAPGNLVYAEYFFDTDPGFGNATAITFTPGVDISNISFNANVSSLTDGNHTFFMRTLDDWSITGYQTFLKGSVLPLRLLSFYAKNNERSVSLEWKTENEINTLHFDVERSSDGQKFIKIGTVAATNQAGTQSYVLNDAQPLTGKNFYRLKQVDKDSKYEYSKTVMVNRSKTLEIQVFPNPAKHSITVAMPLQNTVQTVTLINSKAQVVKVFTVPANVSSLEMPLMDVMPGQYFIKWQSGEDVRIKSFIKME